MKKKRIIIWSVITLLTVIAVLQIFDFHPSLRIGSYKAAWMGVRHMAFSPGHTTSEGHTDCRFFICGPVMFIKYT
jgi:hypothetical protein